VFWSEWDGRGLPEAVALCVGWTEDEDDAKKEVRRLGVNMYDIRLEYGWVGNVDDDLIWDACTEDGECLDTPGTFVDHDTVTKVTFAYVMVQ
jgi:hypothetical protein